MAGRHQAGYALPQISQGAFYAPSRVQEGAFHAPPRIQEDALHAPPRIQEVAFHAPSRVQEGTFHASPRLLEGSSFTLPNNELGYRTAHTCELCGYEPKTKNKYREKQDHLVMKHFKDRVESDFASTHSPYRYICPQEGCTFEAKDKQGLLRHYTGKHRVIEAYLGQALAAKGFVDARQGGPKRRRNSGPQETSGHGGTVIKGGTVIQGETVLQGGTVLQAGTVIQGEALLLEKENPDDPLDLGTNLVYDSHMDLSHQGSRQDNPGQKMYPSGTEHVWRDSKNVLGGSRYQQFVGEGGRYSMVQGAGYVLPGGPGLYYAPGEYGAYKKYAGELPDPLKIKKEVQALMESFGLKAFEEKSSETTDKPTTPYQQASVTQLHKTHSLQESYSYNTYSPQNEEFASPSPQEYASPSPQEYGSPSEMDVSPSQVHASPSQEYVSPSQVDVSPSQVDVSPSQVDVSPSQVDVSPSQVHASPSQEYGSPSQEYINQYQSEISRSQEHVSPPQKYAIPSQEHVSPPQKYAIPSQEYARPPVHMSPPLNYTSASPDGDTSAPAPAEYNGASPQDYASTSPQEYASTSPQEYASASPQEYVSPPSQDYVTPPPQCVDSSSVTPRVIPTPQEFTYRHQTSLYTTPSSYPTSSPFTPPHSKPHTPQNSSSDPLEPSFTPKLEPV